MHDGWIAKQLVELDEYQLADRDIIPAGALAEERERSRVLSTVPILWALACACFRRNGTLAGNPRR